MRIADTWISKIYLLLNIFFYASGGLLLFANPVAAEGVWFFPDTLVARWIWVVAELMTSAVQGWALFSKNGRIAFLVANLSVIALSLSFAAFVTVYPLIIHGESDIARTILWVWVSGVHIFAFIQFWYGAYREREIIKQLHDVVQCAQGAFSDK